MLLNITVTGHEDLDARDLGYLLHKHPDRVQSFDLSFGQAHVFYPVSSPTECTATLLMDIDPIALTRRRKNEATTIALEPYVNDRPYVASSHLSAALSKVYGTALSGRCKNKPDLVDMPMPMTIELPVVPCRGNGELIEALFAPLGYEVVCTRLVLDEAFPQWGMSRYWHLQLTANITLTDALSHLYVLMPVLDDDKHYYIGPDEVDKLLRHGEGWLAQHPMYNQITRRYLDRRSRLIFSALDQLDQQQDDPVVLAQDDAKEVALEKPMSLHEQRLTFVTQTLIAHNARRVVDLGCGEGKLIKKLLQYAQINHVLGVDVTHRALKVATRRLKLESMSPEQRSRVTLKQGSLLYRDPEIAGMDGAAVVEVIEHMEEDRLDTFEQVLFGCAKPGCVVVTTPNVEYNATFEGMTKGQMRHGDHRFEWDRKTFEAWATGIAERHGYAVTFEPIGPVHETLGAPTQAAIFVHSTHAQRTTGASS